MTFTKLKKKKGSINICVFGNENKQKHPIYVSKKYCQEKHVHLLLIGKNKKKSVLIKDLILSYDHTLHRVRKKSYLNNYLKKLLSQAYCFHFQSN